MHIGGRVSGAKLQGHFYGCTTHRSQSVSLFSYIQTPKFEDPKEIGTDYTSKSCNYDISKVYDVKNLINANLVGGKLAYFTAKVYDACPAGASCGSGHGCAYFTLEYELEDDANSGCCSTKSSRKGCEDLTTSSCVCRYYPHCCETGWNATCKQAVVDKGCGICPAGDCCSEHFDNYCISRNITRCVCNQMPDCCSKGWSSECVKFAKSTCALKCPAPPQSNCCEPKEEGGCDMTSISQCACKNDPFCCQGKWDESCVDYAINKCGLNCDDK